LLVSFILCGCQTQSRKNGAIEIFINLRPFKSSVCNFVGQYALPEGHIAAQDNDTFCPLIAFTVTPDYFLNLFRGLFQGLS
jgi:hypothetical protein